MSIRYTTRGSGEDLVIFLHEWLGDSQNWEAIFPYLPTTGYRHVFADLRGYGLSKDISGSYTLDEAAADVFALTRQFNSNNFAIVAHSMSGLIAQHISHTHRDSVRGMMLISPVPASCFRMDAAGFARLIAVTTDDNAAREAISARTGGAVWADVVGAETQHGTSGSLCRCDERLCANVHPVRYHSPGEGSINADRDFDRLL